MPSLPPSSSASANCRVDWRPSRLLAAILLALALLAALSLLLSEMPRSLAVPAAALVFCCGLASCRRELARPPRRLLLAADGSVRVDGRRVEDFQLEWRGPLAFARWRRGGAVQRLCWWPDTLGPAQRRELRLACNARRAAQRRASVAT